MGALVDHLQVCLWEGTHQDDLRLGHILPVPQQGDGGQAGLSLLIPPPPSEPEAASHFPGLPIHTVSPAPQPWVAGMDVQKGNCLATTSPASIFSLSLPVCSYPSVSLHVGAVPKPFACAES